MNSAEFDGSSTSMYICSMKNKSQTILKIFILSIIATSIGCVSSGKYKDLEADKQSTDEQLALCAKTRADLEKKLGITSTENSKLEGSVAAMKKALQDAEDRKQETEKRLAEFRELTSKFKALTDSGKLSVKVRNGRMMIALSTDVLFPSGSAQLSAAGKDAITEVSGVLKDLKNKKYQVEGHTDNVPIRSKQFPSNWELASARAISVLNTMTAAGLPPEQVSAASYGKFDPITDNESEKSRSENRRIAIVVVPDLSGLPGYEELNKL